jgi:hypothetical protein
VTSGSRRPLRFHVQAQPHSVPQHLRNPKCIEILPARLSLLYLASPERSQRQQTDAKNCLRSHYNGHGYFTHHTHRRLKQVSSQMLVSAIPYSMVRKLYMMVLCHGKHMHKSAELLQYDSPSLFYTYNNDTSIGMLMDLVVASRE